MKAKNIFRVGGEREIIIPTITRKQKVVTNFIHFCEAQGKGRAKGRPRKVTIRSFMDGGWWLVVYLSLMLYIKFG